MNYLFFFPLDYKNKTNLIIVCSVLIAALVFDSTIARILNFISSPPLAAFIIVGIIVVTTQCYLLEFVRSIVGSRIKGTLQSVLSKSVRIIQYSLSGIVILVIIQLTTNYALNTMILAVEVSVSYSVATLLLALLAQRLFSWFKSNKTHVVLFYGLSASALSLNSLLTLIFVLGGIFNMPSSYGPHAQLIYYIDMPGSLAYFFNSGQIISSITSFVFTWIATALLLYPYSKRLGRVKYWILVCLPLVYFLSQFPSLFFNFFNDYLRLDPFFYGILLTVIFVISKVAGGLLFAIAFWTMARTIRKGNPLRDYLIVSAIGFILIFVSNQAVILVSAPYPPFSIASTSCMGLAAYMFFIGIFYSAVSISRDTELRKSVRQSAISEFKFVGNIGYSQMENQMQKIVNKVTNEQREQISTKSEVPSLMEQEDITSYMKEVMDEIRKTKYPSTQDQ